MQLILAYLLTGALAGTLAGLLGLGGGIIVVPALASIFLSHQLFPDALVMKMAIGTSLSIMIVTYSVSVYAHNKRDAIYWSYVKVLLPGLCMGVIAGAILVKYLPSTFLSLFFSGFLMLIGLRLLFKKEKTSSVAESAIIAEPFLFVPASILIGMLSSLLGIGGGIMWVPFFLYCKLPMHKTVGTSVACGIISAIIATVCFVTMGFFSADHGPGSSGYIYWPAFVGVAATSVFFAPIGVALAHRLPGALLKKIFAFFLLLVAIDMVLKS